MRRRFALGVQAVAVSVVALALVAGIPGTASADSYQPQPGLKLSSPVKSPWASHTIFDHVVRSINSTPRGAKIRIESWNMRSQVAFNALVNAAKRGVSVQVLIDVENAHAGQDIPNPGFFWMQRQFRQINKNRPPGMRNLAKTCFQSCRGKYGIAHTKLYLFSQVAHAKDVVMYGSFNLTDAAASIQWNDLYTTVGRDDLYNWAMARWAEASRDRPLVNAWAVGSFGPFRFGLFPYYGIGADGDPVLKVLNQVKCTGATGGTGNSNGHTVIRIAQTSEAYDRGERIAHKLKSLWDAGCDIKMLSAIYGDRDRAIYRTPGPRGPMPFRQLATDFNGDGLYDRYLHMKVMTISGVFGAETNATYSWNGSANWERYVLQSDDTFVRVQSAGLVAKYNNYINYWYDHIPPAPPKTTGQRFALMMHPVNPYQNIEVN